jgi:hypothetical protein
MFTLTGKPNVMGIPDCRDFNLFFPRLAPNLQPVRLWD